jgi:hypothetical protein
MCIFFIEEQCLFNSQTFISFQQFASSFSFNNLLISILSLILIVGYCLINGFF